MLIEFSVGNYRSFKDTVTFSMVAANLTAKNKELDQTNVFPLTDAISLLKSCAIYGANASGKSNLIHALRFMRQFVLNSSKDTQADEKIGVEPFLLNSSTAGEPSYFEVIFYAEDKRYRYGFIVDADKVYSEWLYHVPQSREALLFSNQISEFELSSVFKEGKGLLEKTRINALFLSVVAQFNGTIAQTILKWFRDLNIRSGIGDLEHHQETSRTIANASTRDGIISFLRKVDLGIADIELIRSHIVGKGDLAGLEGWEKIPDSIQVKLIDTINDLSPIELKTIHKVFDNSGSEAEMRPFSIEHQESEGTKKLFALAGPIFTALDKGQVFIIDELDARLHPLLTESIVRLFNSNETNPNNAQLVFTTHDTNLLTNKLFRRDQIWFTEKDKYGATDLYSLAEYKVRNDASYEKDYIAGKYGAIPFIGGTNRLVEADG